MQKWLGERIDSAFFYATLMLEEASQNSDHVKAGESMIYQGLAYGYMNEFEEEEKYYLKALTYSSNHSDSVGIGKALLNIGVSQFYRGVLDSAAYYYEQALRVFEPINNTRFAAMSLNNLGQVYSRLDKYEEAQSAYQASLKYKISANDSVAILNTYFNLASLSLADKAYFDALSYSKTTLNLASSLQDSLEIGAAYINLVLAYINLDSLAKAKTNLAKAMEYELLFKSEEMILDLHSAAADLYSRLGEFSKIPVHLNKMKVFLRKDAFPETQMKFYELSYQLAKRNKETDDALSFLEQYMEVKDTYLSESVQKNVADLEKRYQTEQKERQITELELDKQNASLALANSNNQRNIFIFGFVIIMIGSGFLYYRYTNKKKTSDLLAIKNAQITASLEERETLLKEIHHRVKNNLQVISSLLKLQAGSLVDEAAVDAVKEGQHRVKSMALIHQKLYSAEDIRGVDVQDYFENLIDELKQAFGATEVRSEVNTSGLKMDIDTVIPLGLIMNELITNAFKYAFDDLENGRLDLSIVEGGDQLMVTLKDNGKGLDQSTIEASNSFGWKMIRSLSRKIKAEIEVVNNHGTTITLTLSRYKLVS